MAFLQLLSSTAEQNITYHCFNSAAHYDSQKKSYRSALKLMGWNDLELTARGTRRTRYNVVEDECRVCLYLLCINQQS
jgi:hypothetical protein